MAEKTRFIDGKVVVEAARIPEHEMTENLFGHMEDLREILDGIPAQYRGAAKIGIWGDSDLVVTYERPATAEEIEEDRLMRARAVSSSANWLHERIESMIRDANSAGVDLADIWISVEPDSYVIRKKP